MMSAAALRTATTVAARAESGAASWTRWSDWRRRMVFNTLFCRPLTHPPIAGILGQLASLGGEVADRRSQDLTLVSLGLGRGGGAEDAESELAGEDPDDLPCRSRSVLPPRSPGGALRATTAAIGAKNG